MNNYLPSKFETNLGFSYPYNSFNRYIYIYIYIYIYRLKPYDWTIEHQTIGVVPDSLD